MCLGLETKNVRLECVRSKLPQLPSAFVGLTGAWINAAGRNAAAGIQDL